MNAGFLTAALFVIGSAAAAAQLTGEYYLEKTTFAGGEPVFLYYRVSNKGQSTVQIPASDPEQPFCSGNLISVSRDPLPPSSCPFFEGSGCAFDGQPRRLPLMPGESHVDRYLLNFFAYEINAPGNYLVTARQVGTPDKPTLLRFRVDGKAALLPAVAFQPWVDELRSPDQDQRLEAARVLASIAPPAFEETLLGFAENPEFRRYAPLAFHRLNSPHSVKALAHLLTKTEVGSYEHLHSADYLAESGDPQWFPLLLEVAQKHAGIVDYVDDAAELGGDKVVPSLISLMDSPENEFTRVNAVSAMGDTGSRAAVSILLDLLKSSDSDIAERALSGLQELTHRKATDDPNESPQSQYRKWSQWWARDGISASIYKPSECINLTPLP